jgi:hypothetical protein
LLDQHYKNLIIGKNLFSYILGLSLLSNKKDSGNVLILDDYKTSHAEVWTNYLGLIEINFLKRWGEHYDIEPLINLDRYIKPANYNICFNNKVVKLGHNPTRNLIELIRKTPLSSLLSDEDSFDELIVSTYNNLEYFDEECFTFFKKIAEVSFNSLDAVGINLSLISDFIPPLIKKLVDSFMYFNNNYKKYLMSNIQELEILDIKKFLDIKNKLDFLGPIISKAQFIHGDILLSPLQTYYIVSSLISPQYEIIEEDLIKDLKSLLTEGRGDFKSSKIKFWEIYNKNIMGVLLDSFEGLINFDHLHLNGYLDDSMPFKIDLNYPILNSIEVHVSYPEPLFNSFDSKRYLMHLNDSYISDSKFIDIIIKNNNNAILYFYFPNNIVNKLEKIYELIKEDLVKVLKYHNPLFKKDIVINSSKFKAGKNQLIDSTSFTDRRKIHPRTGRKISVCSNSKDRLGNASKLGQVNYLGPLKISNLGTLSFLMDLKYHSELVN